MPCGPNHDNETICLETVTNPFNGTLVSQHVVCGLCSSLTPFLDAGGNLHAFVPLNLAYETTVSDLLSIGIERTGVSTAFIELALQNAVFANGTLRFTNGSTVINANTHTNENVEFRSSGNQLLGNTTVAGKVFVFSGGNNNYGNLTTEASTIPFPIFDQACLETSADNVLNGFIYIRSQADADALFSGKTVWVNGEIIVDANNIHITGGGMLASGSIGIFGSGFSYTTTKCFALYSGSEVNFFNSGTFSVNGVIYSRGNMNYDQSGTICGAVFGGGNELHFRGGNHTVTNQGSCNKTMHCDNICPA